MIATGLAPSPRRPQAGGLPHESNGDPVPKSATWLLERRRDVHSQSGEDGVIEAIFERLPGRNHWCVEFGARDGRRSSNTRNLIDIHGYSAMLIEGDPARARAPRETLGSRPGIVTIEPYVGCSGENRLDALLAGTGVPRDLDLLSIDVDGDDHAVWDAVVDLGRRKGNEPVAVTDVNEFLVRAELLPLLDLESNDAARLRTERRFVTHIFSGYDGTLFLAGIAGLPWHGIDLHTSRFQVLPRVLRRPSAGYGAFHKALFFLWLLVREPRTLLHKLRRRSAQR